RLRQSGRVGDARGWVANLLKRRVELGGLDHLELIESTERSGDLDPAAVHAGNDVVQFAHGVVGVFCLPEETGRGVERHAEAVAMAVRVDLLDIAADFAAEGGSVGEEGIVRRRGAIGVQPQNYAREMGVVWS